MFVSVLLISSLILLAGFVQFPLLNFKEENPEIGKDNLKGTERILSPPPTTYFPHLKTVVCPAL